LHSTKLERRVSIYAHGYVPPQAPLVLPIDETYSGRWDVCANVFLSQGYAFATSTFRKNGVVVEHGADDLNKLLKHFKTIVQRHSLQKVFITGASEGGLIALLLLERYPEKYNAGLALCAPVGGAPDLIKYTYDFRVIFDYFFPTVFTFPPNQPGERPFGAVEVPENAFLFWETIYVPRIVATLTNDPLATVQLFNVTKAAIDVTHSGLMIYGPDEAEPYRRGAVLVDKILRGAKPANLPVEQPTKFDLGINLKTAKQIGLTIH
jgi:pimeloyl-ACP methyl ester carboxylesterase